MAPPTGRCFLLHDNGIDGISDPSNLFLEQAGAVAVSAITVTLDG